MAKLPDNLYFEDKLWQQEYSRLAGIDEVGRGPLAGPVVAAAVIFDPDVYIPEVNDSKKLTEHKREVLFEVIIEKARSFGIGIVDESIIDKINIRQATFLAMRQAIEKLECKPDYLLVDGEALPQAGMEQMGIVKGDARSFTIGAASIIAKVTRDRMMCDYHDEFPLYGFDRHKGYGTQFHREQIKAIGPCRIHRKSFLSKILV